MEYIMLAMMISVLGVNLWMGDRIYQQVLINRRFINALEDQKKPVRKRKIVKK